MIYPQLVPDWVCTTPIRISIEGETLSEDGEPITEYTADLMCNYQDGGKAVLNDEQRVILVSGRAYFNGDIYPQISNLTGGTAIIFGEEREILQGYKRRNPDGTVNHTEILFK